jgi:ABC-2 type transport system permease protein
MSKRKLTAGLKTRAFRAGGYSVMAAALVIAIAVFANMLVSSLPSTWTQIDITSNQLFSISEQTELVVSGLNEDVNIYWVVQSGNEDSTLELLLERYASMSDHISLIKKDPDASPGFTTQYDLDSVSNNSLVVESGTRYRYVAYDDIYEYDYSNYYYTGSYDVSFAGESALTSAISYVVSEDLGKLYLLTGHGESSLSSDFSSAIEQENIETEELTLLTSESVPEDADCVLIYGPQRDISAEELEMLESYLAAGGNLVVLTDLAEEERPNLEALMASYGMEAADGFVIEGDYNYCAMGTPYYLLPEIEYHTITSPLIDDGYYVLLPVAQGLRSSGETRDGLTVSELLTTSDSAFSKISGYSLTTYEKEDGDIAGPFALAMLAEETVDDDTQSRVIWISSTYLLDDQTNMQVSGGNQDFFLNCLGYVIEQESSITIHAKSMSYDYLTMSSATGTMLTLLFVGILPLGYLLIGVRIWYRRKRK